MFKRAISAIAFLVFGLFLFVGTSVIAQTNRPASSPNGAPTSTQFNDIDRQYIQTAGEAAIANIQLSQLALRQATDNQVKEFAQAELNEQVNVRTQLSTIAPRAGVQIPSAPGPKYQASFKRLSQLTGDRFNQAYMSEGGINAHLENAAVYQREAAFGQNPDLVRVANTGLPIINQHFTTASELTNYRFAQVPQRFNNTSATSTGATGAQNRTTPGQTPAQNRTNPVPVRSQNQNRTTPNPTGNTVPR